MHHKLKIWPEFFDDVANGRKTFEYRRDDRNYQIGDKLHIEEFQPMLGSFTGRSCDVDVTYVQRPTRNMEKIGLPEGFCILGIADPAYQRYPARRTNAERKLWLCDSCERPFLVNPGITPNFCPYCRETKLTESPK